LNNHFSYISSSIQQFLFYLNLPKISLTSQKVFILKNSFLISETFLMPLKAHPRIFLNSFTDFSSPLK